MAFLNQTEINEKSVASAENRFLNILKVPLSIVLVGEPAREYENYRVKKNCPRINLLDKQLSKISSTVSSVERALTADPFNARSSRIRL